MKDIVLSSRSKATVYILSTPLYILYYLTNDSQALNYNITGKYRSHTGGVVVSHSLFDGENKR